MYTWTDNTDKNLKPNTAYDHVQKLDVVIVQKSRRAHMSISPRSVAGGLQKLMMTCPTCPTYIFKIFQESDLKICPTLVSGT